MTAFLSALAYGYAAAEFLLPDGSPRWSIQAALLLVAVVASGWGPEGDQESRLEEPLPGAFRGLLALAGAVSASPGLVALALTASVPSRGNRQGRVGQFVLLAASGFGLLLVLTRTSLGDWLDIGVVRAFRFLTACLPVPWGTVQ